jgi:hypothetical protein
MTWESRPELAASGDTVAPIGFRVEVTAVHEHPAHPPSPGCPECIPVTEALKRVCFAVLPRGEHASWYDVHVSAGLDMDPRRRGAPELTASVEILHRGEVNRPPDECERACLAEIRARLTALGVRHGSWTD